MSDRWLIFNNCKRFLSTTDPMYIIVPCYAASTHLLKHTVWKLSLITSRLPPFPQLPIGIWWLTVRCLHTLYAPYTFIIQSIYQISLPLLIFLATFWNIVYYSCLLTGFSFKTLTFFFFSLYIPTRMRIFKNISILSLPTKRVPAYPLFKE